MFLLIFLVFLLFPQRVNAQTISLTLEGDSFDAENNLQVHIDASDNQLNLSNFKVRPRINPPQTLFVYAGGKIFSLGSFWTDIPALPTDLTLHAPVTFQTADLWFEIQNTQTGQILITPKKQVFGKAAVDNYILDLNKSIFME